VTVRGDATTPQAVSLGGAMWTTTSSSPDQTRALGYALGTCLLGGEVIALDGDLGTGKTCFVQGLAEGLGVTSGSVASPTFALRHDHHGRLPLAHLDFYRLEDPDEIAWLGVLDAPDGAVIVIEWAERLPAALPADRLHARLTSGPAPDERAFAWTATGPIAERAFLAFQRTHVG
jgi:tRNA threonylcarbamoyladenosine biosynthesis protein TsaE